MKTIQASRVVSPLNHNRNLTLNPFGAGGIKITSKSKIKNGLRFLLLLLNIALLQPAAVHAIPTNSPSRVLILDETVTGGASSQEALAAPLAIPGCAVDIVSAANWYAIPATGTGGPTGFGFDQYRAIIIGDPMCQNNLAYLDGINALNATKSLWTPACSGNIIIAGVDNTWHALASSVPSAMAGADKTIKRGIAFAVDDPTRTGFYYAMSCFYETTAVATLVPHLSGYGTFKVRGYGTCFDAAHIVAAHPVFTAAPPLTDAELSNWGCSTHEGFTVWPPSFTVLAIALTNGVYTASDGSRGIPYIIARGNGLSAISPMELSPLIATNDLGTPHTVCATLATNATPRVGVPVTFTISSGPNAVTNFTTLTDSNGVACFTYTGIRGLGLDNITATYTNAGVAYHSATATKLWVGACVDIGCPALECLTDGTWSYRFCVTNLNATPLTALSLGGAPAGVSFTPGLIWLSPPLAPGQGTNLTVTINGPAALTNFCFQFGAFTTNEVVPACSIPNCVSLPTCCTRVITNSLTFVSTAGNVSTYNYSITVQNVTPTPVKYVGLGAGQSCVTFLPGLLDLTLPAYGGPSLLFPTQTRTMNLQVQRTAPCPGTNEFYLSTLDTNLVGCCSSKLTLPPAKCVTISLPVDKSYFLAGTPVTMRALAVGPCGLNWVRFYDGTTDLGPASPTTGGVYELTLANGFTAGSHWISAVAQLEDTGGGGAGEVETSEPVELLILAPNDPPEQGH